jgi:microcystin-dependent protein
MNCKTLLIILAFIAIILLTNNNENFAITSLTGPNNMVLSDDQGNLSSINFPKGIIVMWQGNETNVPGGWAICDGTNGTPDLRGRFVLGLNSKVSPPNGLTQNSSGAVGGKEMHTLTIDEMPSHTHKILQETNNSCTCGGGKCACGGLGYVADSKESGGSKPHNIMPPFYVMAYIMKL